MKTRQLCDDVIVVIGGRTLRTDHELMTLADRVARLCPSHRDPMRFHEDKSEIVHALERLAHEVGLAGKGPSSRRGCGSVRARENPRLTGAR